MDSSSLSLSDSFEHTIESSSEEEIGPDTTPSQHTQRSGQRGSSMTSATRNKKPRKRREKVTPEVVRLIILQFNRPNGPSIKEIAENVGVSDPTAKNVVLKMREGMFDCEDEVRFDIKKTGRKSKVTRENARRVREILTSSSTSTLGTAKQILEQENVFLSKSTLCRVARSEGLSIQKISLKPDVVFTERVMELRYDYADQVSCLFVEELWFLDETGFNLHVAPIRCWSDVGHTPIEAVAPSKGQNISLLMCISSDGIKHFELKDGAYKSPEFVSFIQELAEQFPELQNGRACLVMDNARIHHARQARQYLEENHIRHVYLPPFSPDLNPIENVFSVLKKRYRGRGVPTTRAQMVAQIGTAIGGLNQGMELMPYYGRMRRFVQKALNHENFN